MRMSPGTISLSWGRYGGFYFLRGKRLCLGRVAITYLPMEIDDIMHQALDAPVGSDKDSWPRSERAQKEGICNHHGRITLRENDTQNFYCDLPFGHSGAHSDGHRSWRRAHEAQL